MYNDFARTGLRRQILERLDCSLEFKGPLDYPGYGPVTQPLRQLLVVPMYILIEIWHEVTRRATQERRSQNAFGEIPRHMQRYGPSDANVVTLWVEGLRIDDCRPLICTEFRIWTV